MWIKTFRGKLINLNHAVQIYISDVINTTTRKPERWDVMVSFNVTSSEWSGDDKVDYPETAMIRQFKTQKEAQELIDVLFEKLDQSHTCRINNL